MLNQRAITTYFSGHKFRSRHEAKWAAFFSLIGWDWVYEPLDGHGYIPDFLIQGPNPFLVEAKPAVTYEDYLAAGRRVEKGLRGVWDKDVLIVGLSPTPADLESQFDDLLPAGLLGRYGPTTDGHNTLWYESGLWNRCGGCLRTVIIHARGDWAGQPCGCRDGERMLTKTPQHLIAAAWAEASNLTRWNGFDD